METPKSLPLLVGLVSAAGGAMVMWWGIGDRMEKQITDRVNLTSRVAQLGERVSANQSNIDNLRSELAALRQAVITTNNKQP